MSVPVYKRKTSPLEWQTQAEEIRIEIIRLMGSEKIVPKSMRFTLAIPTVRDSHALVREIIHARDTYPTDKATFEKRRTHLINATSMCDVLQSDLILIKRLWDGMNLNRVEKAIVMIDREKQLIRSRIQADRKKCKTDGIID